jgi:hypothetical protein
LSFRRARVVAERTLERRRREDEAPRLSALAPDLETLKLELTEKRGSIGVPEATHIRRVVVEHAPALFLIPCGESSCRDGGHDITHAVLRGLQNKATVYEGDDPCSGHTGTAGCSRTLLFVAYATYKGQ